MRSWLDADGQLTAITIREGKAHIRTRMVETTEYVAERAAGRHLWRGQFGTKKQARRKTKSVEMAGRSGREQQEQGGSPFAHMIPTPMVRASVV